jgi:aerobic-type carbon monoxide dehydrogenase small subunit (CoxS/CutS family)
MENNLRIQSEIERGEPFYIQVNGNPVMAYPGETLATVILAAGWKMFRHTTLSGEPRGPFCGMGLCFDCLVTVNKRQNVRSCVTLAQPGDEVERQI